MDSKLRQLLEKEKTLEAEEAEVNLKQAELREMEREMLESVDELEEAKAGLKAEAEDERESVYEYRERRLAEKEQEMKARMYQHEKELETRELALKAHLTKDLQEMEEEVEKLQGSIRSAESSVDEHHARWQGIKLLENDEEVIKEIENGPRKGAILDQLAQSKAHLQKILGDDPETLIADRRYGFIHGALKETLRHTRKDRRYLSDQVDTVLTNRLLGFPIFIFFIWAMFQLTFSVGQYPMAWIDAGVGLLARFVGGLMGESLLRSLVVDGIISGVGGVAVFLPNIFILFFCIALFEDTGYMARCAFIMDKVMHTLGLHGKSFIPMIMGFGCNVPAIMATRVLESRRDRILTILIIPLISCSARSSFLASNCMASGPAVSSADRAAGFALRASNTSSCLTTC